MQLYTPLNVFGTYYRLIKLLTFPIKKEIKIFFFKRMIQQNFVDMEEMVFLLPIKLLHLLCYYIGSLIYSKSVKK